MSARAVITGVIAMVVLALVLCAAVNAPQSAASFTTESTSEVAATADSTSGWVHVYSQPTDPDGLTGYANQYNVTPATRCAGGQDAGVTINVGRFPTWTSGTYTFNRLVTVKAPTPFPEASVGSVTVTVARVADPASGRQPISSATLNTVGSGGGAVTATMSAGQKLQLNMTISTTWWWFLVYGDTYTPHVTLTISFPGPPSGYYVYDYPVNLTIA